jgi:radical SAM-linked protein
MRYWIKFTKLDKQKYISHRDMHKAINRIITRAKLPVAFSQGFNPHQKISFSSPLELGIASKAEYLDLELTNELNVSEILFELNNVSPIGFEFLQAQTLVTGAPKLMAWIELAKYTAEIDDERKVLETIEDLLKRTEIMVEKRSKRKLRMINIRSFIHEIKLYDGKLDVILQTGQKGNLKVSQFIEIFNEYSDKELSFDNIIKEEVFGDNLGQYIPPFVLLNQLDK